MSCGPAALPSPLASHSSPLEEHVLGQGEDARGTSAGRLQLSGADACFPLFHSTPKPLPCLQSMRLCSRWSPLASPRSPTFSPCATHCKPCLASLPGGTVVHRGGRWVPLQQLVPKRSPCVPSFKISHVGVWPLPWSALVFSELLGTVSPMTLNGIWKSLPSQAWGKGPVSNINKHGLQLSGKNRCGVQGMIP